MKYPDKFNVAVDEETGGKIRRMAELEERSTGYILRELIEYAMKKLYEDAIRQQRPASRIRGAS